MAAGSPMDEFKGIPGWSPEMEELYRKRIQERVEAMTTGPFSRIIRTAIVNPSFRQRLEDDPAAVLKENGFEPKGESIVLVQEDRGVFPIVIPKVLKPYPFPEPPFPEPRQSMKRGFLQLLWARRQSALLPSGAYQATAIRLPHSYPVP